jgi:hypothetical protein
MGIKLTGFFELTDLKIEGFTIYDKSTTADNAVITADSTLKINNLEIKACILDGRGGSMDTSVSGRVAILGSKNMIGIIKITGTTF